MKKTFTIVFFVLLLAACNSPQGSSSTENNDPAEVEPTEEQQDELVENEDETDSSDLDESVSDEQNASDEQNTQSTEENKSQSSASQNDQKSSDNKGKAETQEDKHQEIIDLSYDIMKAQDKQDYDFLQSILSSGTKLNKKNNKLKFENVTYPHEQKFLTEKDIGELEFRYTHETDNDSVIVGFGAINYETESSFTIDFEYIRENGNWKMNDMDLNK